MSRHMDDDDDDVMIGRQGIKYNNVTHPLQL